MASRIATEGSTAARPPPRRITSSKPFMAHVVGRNWANARKPAGVISSGNQAPPSAASSWPRDRVVLELPQVGR